MTDQSEKKLLKPEPFDLLDSEGKAKTFILSNFDAITGREIITQYPLTALPKAGDYPANKELMLKLMTFVAVVTADGRQLQLSTPELIMNHVDNAEMLMKIEAKMMWKNCSFFRDGRCLDLLDTVMQMFTKKLLETLTQSSDILSQQEKSATTNSEPSTT